MTNMDPRTGIRYTIFSANELDTDLFADLWMHGTNVSEAAADREEIARQRSEWEDECERLSVAALEEGTDLVLDDFEPDLDNFDPQIEEPTIEGVYEGVTYIISYLGGAPIVWIIESPLIGHFYLCSPCCPGACNGGSRNSKGLMGYDVPPDWLFVEPDDLTFQQRLEQSE